MKIKIFNKYTKKCEFLEETDSEKDVFAFFIEKKFKYYLIFNEDMLYWIDNKSKLIQISDYDIPSNWVFLENLIYKNGIQTLKMNNILCPKWMSQDQDFFFETFQEQNTAYEKFFNKEIWPIIEKDCKEADSYFKHK